MAIAPKKINYDVAIKSTNHTRSYYLPPEVYTSDTAVQFRFNILDVEAAEFTEGAAVSTVEITTRDGSFFQHVGETSLEGTTVVYDLKEAEGNHAGLAKIQLKINLGGDYFTSDEYEFKIINSIATGVPVEIYVQNWETLTTQANAYLTKMAEDIEDFDVALETGVLATNIAAKLIELQTTYAPRLLSVEQQLEHIETTKADLADLPSSAYTFKGSTTFALLPTTGNVLGDVYFATDTVNNYAWTGTEWTPIGDGAFANGSVSTQKLAEGATTPEKTNFIDIEEVLSENRLDRNNCVRGYYSGTTWVDSPTGTYVTTDYIKVDDLDVLYFYRYYVGTPGSIGTTSIYGVAKFDINKNILSSETGTGISYIPGSEVYVRLTINSNLATWNITQYYGAFISQISTWSEYNKVIKYTLANNIMLPNEGTYSKNPLYGKIITSNGDSITYGTGNGGISYVDIIASNHNMIMEKRAVGGATLITGSINTDLTNRHWIVDDITNMRSDADYVILSGGVNDFYITAPIGELTWGWETTLDITTVYGAMESICRQILAKWPTKKVLFVVTHEASSTPLTNPWESYRIAIVATLEKYGIEYIDMNKVSPLKMTTNAIKTAFIPDNIHPNDSGYRVFYVDKITAKLKAI